MPLRLSYHARELLTTRTATSITGTSISTPTTAASAAPDSKPNSAIAVATASSKKLLAPIRATEDSQYNYIIPKKDSHVYLFGSEKDVAPLCGKEISLLEAINQAYGKQKAKNKTHSIMS